MKTRTAILIAMAALLTLTAATGCGSGSSPNPNPQPQVAERVYYTVDGAEHDTLLTSEAQWHYLISDLLTLADGGSTIAISTHSIVGQTVTVSPGSQTVTLSTTDRTEARNWCHKMVKRGYTVSIRKDSVSGTYHCSATR